MKHVSIVLLAALALAARPAAAAADAPTEISVSGSGTVIAVPNVANVDAVVETTAPNPTDAVSENNARYTRIVDALVRLGIARSDVTLASYYVNYNPPPQPQATPPNPGERYGYTVSRSFTVKVRDVGRAGRVTDACTADGAGINGVSFGLADNGRERAQAAAKAVADARANAQTLARAAGLQLVGIKSIESSGGGPIVPMLRMAAANAAPATQFDQSNVNVTVTVTVVFLAR